VVEELGVISWDQANFLFRKFLSSFAPLGGTGSFGESRKMVSAWRSLVGINTEQEWRMWAVGEEA
jgi:hypothetical protein